MLYTCSRCQLILPNDLVMNLKKCPTCGQTPKVDFKTKESLLSQGYRCFTPTDPGAHTAPADPTPRRNPASIPDVPVEVPHTTPPADIPQPPSSRSNPNRANQGEIPPPNPTPAPQSAPVRRPVPEPAPGPRPAVEPEPTPRQSPPQSRSAAPGPQPIPQHQSGAAASAPTKRPGSTQPPASGGGAVEGGPVGGNTGNRSSEGPNINFPLIFQLLLLLAASIVLGILIYSIWSMREQIIEALTTFLFFVIVIAGAIFLLRRRL